MQYSRTPLSAVVGSILLLAACQDGPPSPVSPDADGPQTSQGTPSRAPAHRGGWLISQDDRLAALVDQAPGFAGFYYEAPGGPLVVRVTDSGRAEQVGPVVRALLADRGGATATLTFRRAEYDFRQLAQWRDRLNEVQIQGRTLTDVDEVRNRVVVGVLDASTAETVRATVTRLGIPTAAVVVEEVAPTVINASLQDVIRPIAGGIQVQAPGTCTLNSLVVEAYPTYVDYTGPKYLLTNSHCTDAFGSVTGSTMGQPTLSYPVGTEYLDPPLFTNAENSACPAGRKCRYSDAALFQVNSGVDVSRFGYVAWTNLNSLTFTGYTKMEGHEGLFTAVGDPTQKVGRTTGRTAGKVTATCVNVDQYERDPYGNIVDTGRTMLCQMQADYGSGGGDSGSPVLGQGIYQTDKFWYHGIHWGSSSIAATYTSYHQLRDELKRFTPGGWEPWFVDLR